MRLSDVSRLSPKSTDDFLSKISRIREDASVILLTDPDAPYSAVGHLSSKIISLCDRVISSLENVRAILSTPVSKFSGKVETKKHREKLKKVGTVSPQLGRVSVNEISADLFNLGVEIRGESKEELINKLKSLRPQLDFSAKELCRALNIAPRVLSNLDYSVAEQYLFSIRKEAIDEMLTEAEKQAARGKYGETIDLLALSIVGLSISSPAEIGKSQIMVSPDISRAVISLKLSSAKIFPLQSPFEEKFIDMIISSGNKSENVQLKIPAVVRPTLESSDLSKIFPAENSTVTIKKTERPKLECNYPAGGVWDFIYHSSPNGIYGTLTVIGGEIKLYPPLSGDPDFGEVKILVGEIVKCVVPNTGQEFNFRISKIETVVNPPFRILTLIPLPNSPVPTESVQVSYFFYYDNRFFMILDNYDEEYIELPYFSCTYQQFEQLLTAHGAEVAHVENKVHIYSKKFGRKGSIEFSDGEDEENHIVIRDNVERLFTSVPPSFDFTDLSKTGVDGQDRLFLEIRDENGRVVTQQDIENPQPVFSPGVYILEQLATILAEYMRLEFVVKFGFPDWNPKTVVDRSNGKVFLRVYGPAIDGRISVTGRRDHEDEDISTANTLLLLSPSEIGKTVTKQDLEGLWYLKIKDMRADDKFGPLFDIRIIESDGGSEIQISGVNSVAVSGDGLSVFGISPGTYKASTNYVKAIGNVRVGSEVSGLSAIFMEKQGEFWVLSSPIPVDSKNLELRSVGSDSISKIPSEINTGLTEEEGIPSEKWSRWLSQCSGDDKSEAIGEVTAIVTSLSNIRNSLSKLKWPSVPAMESVFSAISLYKLDKAEWYLMTLQLNEFFNSRPEILSTTGTITSGFASLFGKAAKRISQ